MERSSGRTRKASQKIVESREIFLVDESATISKRKVKSSHKDQVTDDTSLHKQSRTVYQVPEPPVFPVDQFIPCSVALSLLDKAKQISVSADQLTCTGAPGGFRMIRATHGVHSGPYYWECEILPPPSSSSVSGCGETSTLLPHVRVGWSTRFGQLNGPVGYDKHSYGYRDLAGEVNNTGYYVR